MDKIYTIEEISKLVSSILNSNNVNKAFLFGSYAKGTQNEKSDIDIYAEFQQKQSLLDICGILYDIREALQKDVDFYDVNEFSSQPEFLNSIKKDGVCIYEKQ